MPMRGRLATRSRHLASCPLSGKICDKRAFPRSRVNSGIKIPLPAFANSFRCLDKKFDAIKRSPVNQEDSTSQGWSASPDFKGSLPSSRSPRKVPSEVLLTSNMFFKI
ncbi:heat shock protein 60 [Moniliophthora roreri]|nr:heat shock protein 60 [Moniliophthora roreri]